MHVHVNEANQIHIEEVVRGDTVREVLQYVQFNADELLSRMHKDVERAVRENTISVAESALLLRFYESGLQGYTYLEEPHDR